MGRPPKQASSNGAAEENNAQEASKKVRGRPRKDDGEPKTKPTPTPNPDGPRKRGRPKGSTSASSKPPKPRVLNPDGTPRGRGRPRLPGSTGPKPPVLNADGVPRKRGRPRKSDVAGEESESAKKRKVENDKAEAKTNKVAKKIFPLDNIIGRYDLSCAKIQNNWPDQAAELELAINETDPKSIGLEGTIDLGIAQATLLLTVDKNELPRLATQMTEKTSNDNAPAKPYAEVSSRRVYFLWRSNAGEFSADNDTQAGHIDFTDDEANQFTGVINELPSPGEQCEFSGKRVDAD